MLTIESGSQVSLVSFAAEGKALAAPARLGAPVTLAEAGSVASTLTIWRTGFRYEAHKMVGYGTGTFEAGPIHYGACVAFLTLNDHFLTSPDDGRALSTGFRNNMPADSEAFILLNEHGLASQAALEYGDTVILRRANGRYLNCTNELAPGFRSIACTPQEKFRIWF